MPLDIPGGTWAGYHVAADQYDGLLLDRPYFFEAKLKLDTPQNKYSAQSVLILIRPATYGHVSCGIEASQPSRLFCRVMELNYPDETIELVETPASLGQWYTVRMELDPLTKVLTVYVDGRQILAQELPQPEDPARTLSHIRIYVSIGVYIPPELAATMTGYVDDVRIGPVE